MTSSVKHLAVASAAALLVVLAATVPLARADDPIDIVASPSAESFDGLSVSGGETAVRLIDVENVTVRNCSISATGGPAIVLRNVTNVRIEHCMIGDANRDRTGDGGILIENSADVVLDTVDVQRSFGAGIRIVNSDNVTITAGSVTQTSGDGIVLDNAVGVVLTGIRLIENRGSGIVATGLRTSGDIVSLVAERNTADGAWFSGTRDKILLQDFTADTNRGVGIRLAWGVGSLDVVEPILLSNAEAGVRLERSCGNRIEGAVIDDPGRPAFEISFAEEPSDPNVDRSRSAACAPEGNVIIGSIIQAGIDLSYVNGASDDAEAFKQHNTIDHRDVTIVYGNRSSRRGAVLGASTVVQMPTSDTTRMVWASMLAVALLFVTATGMAIVRIIRRGFTPASLKHHTDRRAWGSSSTPPDHSSEESP